MREAQRDFTHTLLVDAAICAFARHGYHKTTIEQIVVEAGASRATFYLYFHDLFRPVYDATAVDPGLYRSLFPMGFPELRT